MNAVNRGAVNGELVVCTSYVHITQHARVLLSVSSRDQALAAQFILVMCLLRVTLLSVILQ